MSLDLSTLDASMFALAPDDAGRVHDHFVEIYDDDESLVDSLARFVGLGIAEDETVFVVATREHREMLEQRLDDLGDARDEGSYIALDADAVLERLVVDGIPRAERFEREIGDKIEVATRGGRKVRVFGEMVALLWDEGNVGGALSLEDLWNALADGYPFRLFCAYPSSSFGGENLAPLRAVCQRHSHVITPPRD
jgi:MEDS: MEthanogen/methylotroph, DcmR Sensory domain